MELQLLVDREIIKQPLLPNQVELLDQLPDGSGARQRWASDRGLAWALADRGLLLRAQPQ